MKRALGLAAALCSTAALLAAVAALRASARRLEAGLVLTETRCEILDRSGNRADLIPPFTDRSWLVWALFPTRTTANRVEFGGGVAPQSLAAIAELSEIEEVLFFAITLDRDHFIALSQLDGLKKLDIVDCEITEAQLNAIQQALPNCRIQRTSTSSTTGVPNAETEALRRQFQGLIH